MLRDCDFRPVFHRAFNHEPFRHISQPCPGMPANGLLYARRSGQGDLEPDGEAVAGVRRILRGPPISVRHAGRDPPPKDAFTFGLRAPLALSPLTITRLWRGPASLAMLAAMRRASSRISSLAAERWHDDWSLARTRGSSGQSEWARSAVDAFPRARGFRDRAPRPIFRARLFPVRGGSLAGRRREECAQRHSRVCVAEG